MPFRIGQAESTITLTPGSSEVQHRNFYYLRFGYPAIEVMLGGEDSLALLNCPVVIGVVCPGVFKEHRDVPNLPLGVDKRP